MNTVLVVEDEKLIRQGIVAMIRRCSVPVGEIVECRNGGPENETGRCDVH